MKKIILISLLSLISSKGFSQQLSTNTESFTSGIPATWSVFDNGVGTSKSWTITSIPADVYSEPNSAEILRENIEAGNTSEDWMVTNLQNILVNQQFRFYTRTSLIGDRGTVYQIRISETNQTDPSKFTILKSYTSIELSQNPTVYEEKVISLAEYSGKNLYIAFVRVFDQPTQSISGDKWLVDNVRIVPECTSPTDLSATSITATSAQLNWVGTAPKYNVQYFALDSDEKPILPGTFAAGVPSPYNAVGLTPVTKYYFYVQSVCGVAGDIKGEWVGPYKFETRNLGSLCVSPLVVGTLPFEVKADNTSFYGDDIGNNLGDYQGASCGASPPNSNYLQGDDVFYSYTAKATGSVNIVMTPLKGVNNSSLFVYNDCADIGVNCITGKADGGSNPRDVSFQVTKDETYIIVISSNDKVQSVPYNLVIQNQSCEPKPTNLDAKNPTLTTVELSWTSAGFSNWEIAVQPFGESIPSGSGTNATNPVIVQNLTGATNYQYWVRAECTSGSGTFTAWAGPYVFNTLICDIADSCEYTFSMTDSQNNGWNGAEMQIRQNGIVVATIGKEYITGSGPVNIPVSLCNDVPFDLYWSVAGLQPQQCIVAIINKFGQTIYTKPANTGAQGEILYDNIVNCTTPLCDIAPTNVVVDTNTITTTSATIDWYAPATNAWDIYLVPTGTAPPTADTPPTNTNVSKPFQATGLSVDSSYDVYVRVECSPSNSPWSVVYTFSTLESCPKPTNLTVADRTTTSATLGWTNGAPSDTSWEILLIPTTSYTTPPTPGANPILEPGSLLIPTTNPSPLVLPIGTLAPATIYYYYIRTVCSGNEKSNWAGPIFFNTITCDNLPGDKCDYTFKLLDTGKNGWDGAQMQVRQNGIVIRTIGSSITGQSSTVPVPICNDVPFDLYWSEAGTEPQEVGISIIDPFGDLIYTKPPGEGSAPEVLFSSIGDCSEPTCPKPRDLTVNAASITTTSAELGWTEWGTATQWELYVVPVGSPLPVNGAPVTGVKPYYIATSNPFTVNGLLPGTAYVFYVRALCSDDDISTWTILTSQTFVTTAANDECDFAISVPVNPTRACTQKVSGNTLGATQSLPPITGSCSGVSDDDVWFSFVATNSIQLIELSNLSDETENLNHIVYSGNCSNLTQLYCNELNYSSAFNLVVGQTYWIRVYTANGSLTTDSVTFDVCVSTPDPITNDECSTAKPVTPNNNLKCGDFTIGAVTGATASAEQNICLGNADDDVWYSFVANSNFQTITLATSPTSTSPDLNHAVYSGECGNLTLEYCSDINDNTSAGEKFIKGKTYYIRIWSNSSSQQDIVFALCIGTTSPPITTSDTEYTNDQLVTEVLLKSKCVSVSNITYSTGVDYGSTNGIGSFDASLSDFPFKDGVILSTGWVLEAPGPKYGIQSFGTPEWLGDLELNNIIEKGTGINPESQNASKLEFDFIPLIDKLRFNFMFASEEYGNFQCNYGDSFAFILTDLTVSGPAINLAVVPDTTTPISVITINNTKYNRTCPSKNPEFFGEYYGYYTDSDGNVVNNDPTHEAPINYNGVTIPMTVKANLIPGHQYHIKMVIADSRDSAWDSAVFIEGKSFDIGGVDLGPDEVGANSICYGSTTTLNSGLDNPDYSISWMKDGVTIPNETSPTLVVSTPGTYTVNAALENTTCVDSDSITVEYFPEIDAGTPINLAVCDGSGVGTFNLTQNTPILLDPLPSDGEYTVVYYASDPNTSTDPMPISNPTTYQNTSNPQTIYARVSDLLTGCNTTPTFQINAQNLPPQFTLSGAMEICPQGSTVITVVPTDNSFDVSIATYIWTFKGNVLTNETSSSLAINNGAQGYGDYTVTVNNGGCVSTQDFSITIDNTPISIGFQEGCNANDYQLTAIPEDGSFNPETTTYLWTNQSGSPVGSNSDTITLDTAGTYTVNIKTAEGCTSSNYKTVNNIACTIQQGISPDNDGLNDNFDLSALNVKHLDIFNRYGIKVYSMGNYTNQWYGTTNDGKELPDGTYYYVIERENVKSVTGWIYVIHKN